MAETLKKLGYNEFLDRTIGLPDNPIGAEKKIYAVGNNVVGAAGSTSLFGITESPFIYTRGLPPILNENGVIDDSFQFSSRYEANEDMEEGQATAVQSAKLKLTGNTSPYRFAGFTKSVVFDDDFVAVKTGPVVNGVVNYTGGVLGKGRIYIYAPQTFDAGDVLHGTSATWGGVGGAESIPAGLSINDTDLRLYYGGTARTKAGVSNLSNPSIGSSSNTIINVGFINAHWFGIVYAEASDSTGSNTQYGLGFFSAQQGNVSFIKTDSTGSSIGTETDLQVEASSGTNRSSITVDVNYSVSTAGPVVRVTNATTAGTGSSNASAKLLYIIFG